MCTNNASSHTHTANNTIHSIVTLMLVVVAASYCSSSRAVVAATAATTRRCRGAGAVHHSNHIVNHCVGGANTSFASSRSRSTGSGNISSICRRSRRHHHHAFHHHRAMMASSSISSSISSAAEVETASTRLVSTTRELFLRRRNLMMPSITTRLFHHDSSTATDEDAGYIPTTTMHSVTNDVGTKEEDYNHQPYLNLDDSGNDEDEEGNEEGAPPEGSSDDDSTAIAADSASQTWQNPRSRWAKRKHRKKMEKQLREGNYIEGEEATSGDDSGVLDWETFEFGTSPKMDKRFDDSDINDSANQTGIPNHILNTIATNTVTYQTYLQHEANIDKSTSTESIRSKSELLSLSPDIVEKSINILSPYILPRRMERIESILQKRTKHARFLFENPSNPSNVWACLRTLDSFGIQYVDVIVNSESYQGKAAVNQKRGMRTAMGSAVWMTIRQFGSIDEAITSLREEEGCLVYASDLNPNAKDVRDLVWDVDFDAEKKDVDNNVEEAESQSKKQGQRPICIVMGNEERGISDEMRSLADETFYLPMCGFAESFNLSVATAITLAYMSAVSGRGGEGSSDATAGSDSGIKGPLRPGDLDPHELQCLKLRGVINSLAQKRMGKALLKQEGIVLPSSLYKDV